MAKKHDSDIWLVNRNRFWVFIGQHWHVSGHSGGEQWCPGGVGCGKVLTGTIDEGTTSVTWLLMVTMTFLSGLIYLVFKTTWVILRSMVNCQQYFFYSTIFSNTFMKQEIIFDMSCKSNCIMIIKDAQKCFYIYNPKDHRIKQRSLARMK